MATSERLGELYEGFNIGIFLIRVTSVTIDASIVTLNEDFSLHLFPQLKEERLAIFSVCFSHWSSVPP
jgi:hypothetical protein